MCQNAADDVAVALLRSDSFAVLVPSLRHVCRVSLCVLAVCLYHLHAQLCAARLRSRTRVNMHLLASDKRHALGAFLEKLPVSVVRPAMHYRIHYPVRRVSTVLGLGRAHPESAVPDANDPAT